MFCPDRSPRVAVDNEVLKHRMEPGDEKPVLSFGRYAGIQ